MLAMLANPRYHIDLQLSCSAVTSAVLDAEASMEETYKGSKTTILLSFKKNLVLLDISPFCFCTLVSRKAKFGHSDMCFFNTFNVRRSKCA